MVLEIDYEPKARPLRIGVYTECLPDTKRRFHELCWRSGAEIAMETPNRVLLREGTDFIFLTRRALSRYPDGMLFDQWLVDSECLSGAVPYRIWDEMVWSLRLSSVPEDYRIRYTKM